MVVTKPAQPLAKATAKARTTQAAGHTNPFIMVFTLPPSFGLASALKLWRGLGARENGCVDSPDLHLKDREDVVPVLLARGVDLVQV